MSTYFEWDDDKAASNRKKHGVSFETALRAFADPHASFEADRVVGGEQRWQVLGKINERVILLVAHTFLEDDGDEVVRIISARELTPHERRRYDDGSIQG